MHTPRLFSSMSSKLGPNIMPRDRLHVSVSASGHGRKPAKKGMESVEAGEISSPAPALAPAPVPIVNVVSEPASTAPALAKTGSKARSVIVAPGETVLVLGATGGVGQLLTAKLIERGYKVRAVIRSASKAAQLLGSAPGLSFVEADGRKPETLTPALFQGVSAVLWCTGTTAFPSARWEGGNTPRATDYDSCVNVVNAVQQHCEPGQIGRFVMVSSAGVERFDRMPYLVLNLFSVLRYKKAAEDYVKASGLPYTFVRPGRLTDGPYTSYDLNTLLKATSGTRRSVVLSVPETLQGQTSRIVVAEALVQSLTAEETAGRAFSVESAEGEGPGTDGAMWKSLFKGAGL